MRRSKFSENNASMSPGMIYRQRESDYGALTPASFQDRHETVQKLIEEFISRVNTGSDQISIAKMTRSAGWEESGQKPEFDGYTIILKFRLKAKTANGVFFLTAGQAYHTNKGKWV